MEKYYCENCRILYDGLDVCRVCGNEVINKIWIEVQNQNGSSELRTDQSGVQSVGNSKVFEFAYTLFNGFENP